MGRRSTWPAVGRGFQRERRRHASGAWGQSPGPFRQSLWLCGATAGGSAACSSRSRWRRARSHAGHRRPREVAAVPPGRRRRAHCPRAGSRTSSGGSVPPLLQTAPVLSVTPDHFLTPSVRGGGHGGLLLLGGRARTPGSRSVRLASRSHTVDRGPTGTTGCRPRTPWAFPPTLEHNSTIFVATKENPFIRHRAQSC